MTARQLTGDDLGIRVRIRESETHMLGGSTGTIVGWSLSCGSYPRRIKVKLDLLPRWWFFCGLPEEIEQIPRDWVPVPDQLVDDVVGTPSQGSR